MTGVFSSFACLFFVCFRKYFVGLKVKLSCFSVN